ncbi:MAG: hypothetical protein ABI042_19200 [Verrucomicrobiota bacterium]
MDDGAATNFGSHVCDRKSWGGGLSSGLVSGGGNRPLTGRIARQRSGAAVLCRFSNVRRNEAKAAEGCRTPKPCGISSHLSEFALQPALIGFVERRGSLGRRSGFWRT